MSEFRFVAKVFKTKKGTGYVFKLNGKKYFLNISKMVLSEMPTQIYTEIGGVLTKNPNRCSCGKVIDPKYTQCYDCYQKQK